MLINDLAHPPGHADQGYPPFPPQGSAQITKGEGLIPHTGVPVPAQFAFRNVNRLCPW